MSAPCKHGFAGAKGCKACAREKATPVPRAIVLARIREIGQAEVARRVCDRWGKGWSPASAASRLTRWMKDPSEPGFKDMSSEALFALISSLGMTIDRVDEEKR